MPFDQKIMFAWQDCHMRRQNTQHTVFDRQWIDETGFHGTLYLVLDPRFQVIRGYAGFVIKLRFDLRQLVPQFPQ